MGGDRPGRDDGPGGGRPKSPLPRATGLNVAYLVLALLAVLLLREFLAEREVEQIPYSEFQRLLEAGEVESVEVGRDQIEGSLKQPLDGRSRFVTNRVDPDLVADLERHGVRFSGERENPMLPLLLSWLLPVLLFVAVWMFLIRRMTGRGPGGPGAGFMSIGKSQARVYVETDTRVSFEDVAGVDEAKLELEEIVAFLKDPRSYGRLGARMPKGVLLVGPPGTGKTLLARAVAGEAGVPFFSISGSEFVEMFVGVGAARVRDLFEQARAKAPCIIFIDELDALGRARGAQPGMGGHDEKEQTLNQLLVELDGFDPSIGIVLLAATNRPEILDPALLRAGRFDRQVLLDRPDRPSRVAILRVHLVRVKAGPDVDPEKIAGLTPGFTGADLANLVNEAALVATRRRADAVTMDDVTAAIERIVAGLEKRNRLLNPRERRIVAHHEMGHALVAGALPGTDAVHKVSIIPRGIGALGFTLQRPTEDRYLMTREELENKLTVLLGGRAAEDLVYGELSTGAADDLGRATDIARSMVSHYAMWPELGHATWGREPSNLLGTAIPGLETRTYSEETAREIDCAIRDIVDGAFARARAILERNDALLREAAQRLLELETLDEAELAPLFARIAAEPGPADAGG